MRVQSLDDTLIQPEITQYKELTYKYKDGDSAIWIVMKPRERQCFTLTLLIELLDIFHHLDDFGSPWAHKPGNVKYMILCSEHPEIFNTGGDLSYFYQLAQEKDRERLMEYAVGCIDLIHWAMVGGKRNMTTVANVTGEALGGGFEAALACNYIFSEKQARFGFPEVVFGVFPGMGGYPLFERHVGAKEADIAFTTGKRYSAQELDDFGAVYRLCEKGQNDAAISEFIDSRESLARNHWALQKIKQRMEKIDYQLLKFNIDLWVDSAIAISDRDLRVMNMLIKRQLRRV